jgi:hypothetical protein
VQQVDFGIGYTEAWGIPHVHKDVHDCSDCCEAEVVTGWLTIDRELLVTARKDYPEDHIKKGDQYWNVMQRGYFVYEGERVQYNLYERKEKLVRCCLNKLVGSRVQNCTGHVKPSEAKYLHGGGPYCPNCWSLEKDLLDDRYNLHF